jgi:acyl-CoA synthetase (AMP-forming)/AMP-acid ligase II
LAYLDGRYGFSYDWRMLSSFVSGMVGTIVEERRDTLNLFYELETHARSSRAHHVWIIFQGQSWTYAQAYDIVLRYATWFKAKGVQKGDIVAMDFVNSDVFVWVWFGLWSVGAKPAFINYNLTGKSLVHTVKTSTAHLVLVDQESKDNFRIDVMEKHGFTLTSASTAGQSVNHQYTFEMNQSEVPKSVKRQTAQQGSDKVQRQLEVVVFDKKLQDSILALQPTRLPDSERSDQKRATMAMLIYTSGTTGLPKPAIVSWAKVSGGSKVFSGWASFKNDIIYTSMPLYHASASVLGLCAVLRSGATICLSKKFSHKNFWPEVRASKATVIQYVGETCRYLLSAPPNPLDKQHNVHTAYGNGLRPDIWEPFKQRFNITTVLEFYAATEAPGGMWNRSSNTFSSGAIGRNGLLASQLFTRSMCLVRPDPDSASQDPLRSSTTQLCELVAPNEPGELLFKLDAQDTSQRFQGYFNNDAATSSKILRNVRTPGDAWFRSGDLVRLDTEGRWFFVDRTGDTFRWKAENVSTAEVADALGRHPAVETANVYGVQVPLHDGRAGCAAVVLKSATNADKLQVPSDAVLRELAAHVKKELPSFAQPVWLRFTRALEMTGTNKLQKTDLQREGINVGDVEAKGDLLFWLRGGVYERFTEKDLDRIQGGGVKL